MQYRPELDGIRGAAIAAVVGCHACIPGFGGGWIGVDVFFALSGFLITSLLDDEFKARSSIDLPRFYARRALRLLPALAATVVLVLVAAWWWSPEHRAADVRSGFLASTYLANWPAALEWHDLRLFRHSWSLAVEEQFYLLWPLAIPLVLRRREPAAGARLLLLLAALVGAHRLHLYSAGAQYSRLLFGSDTRCDALLAGCAAALLAGRADFDRSRTRIVKAMSWVSAAILVALGILLRPGTIWPYVGGISAAAGASGVLLFGLRSNTPLRDTLSWGPLVWLGRRSYGLYLVHYPILKFVEPMGPTGTAAGVLCSLAASAALSRYLETPARAMRNRLNLAPLRAPASRRPLAV